MSRETHLLVLQKQLMIHVTNAGSSLDGVIHDLTTVIEEIRKVDQVKADELELMVARLKEQAVPAVERMSQIVNECMSGFPSPAQTPELLKDGTLVLHGAKDAAYRPYPVAKDQGRDQRPGASEGRREPADGIG